jgi:hypothetical protein
MALNALLAAVLLTYGGHAKAQSNEFELDWQGPPNCPEQSAVTAQVRAILGAAPGATLPRGMHAKGVIEPIEERYQLTLTVRVGAAERSRVIVSDDCGSLGKAAAVVLSLLIRRANESGTELSEIDLGGVFEPLPELSPPTGSKVPPPPVVERQERDWQWLLWAPTLGVDYLMLPKVGFGIGAAAGVTRGAWRGFVTGMWWPEQRVAGGGVEPYEASFKRTSIEAWGCHGWRRGVFEVAPCGLAAIDLVNASASGDRFTTSPHRIPIVSFGTGFIGFLHLGRNFRLFCSTTGRISVYRTDFVVDAMMESVNAHVVPWGTLMTSMGTELVF